MGETICIINGDAGTESVKDVEQESEKNEKVDSICQYNRTFEPYLKLYRLFGIGWAPPGGKTCARFIGFLYTFFTFIFIGFNINRGLHFLIEEKKPKFSPVLVFKFILLLYAIHCMSAYLMIVSSQAGPLRRFIDYWKTTVNSPKSIYSISPYFKLISRVTVLGLLYTVGVSFVNGVFVALGSIHLVIEFPFMKSYFYDEDVIMLNGLNVFFTSISFCGSQMLYSSICFVIVCEFFAFEKHITNLSTVDLISNLPALRRKHHHLKKLTMIANGLLNYYAFAIYVFNAPASVMVAFLLVRAQPETPISPASRFTLAIWVGVLLLQVGIVSVLPAIINYYAHSSMTHVEETANLLTEHNIPMPANVYRELALFISQMSQYDIGITGGGFFLVTKSFLLTLISIMVSYFTLIVQLDVMGSKDSCVCSSGPKPA